MEERRVQMAEVLFDGGDDVSDSRVFMREDSTAKFEK